ncbi:MAG: TonB-dependent receptor [Gammaproteobacteria bacterium]|nr:TonB-dependent receptor [Gammaproteobacteria bacterium]
MTMRLLTRRDRLAALAVVAVLAATPGDAAPIEEITVTSQLREQTLQDLPVSITSLDAEAIDRATVQHFEELTRLVPNLNWSGEGSRARYFQLRGTGELEQYEGAPNPSVGFIVDDIDFSGIGGAATLFDMQTAEVLRGPQGTRYGANALAGLVYLRSADPGPEPEVWLEASGGNDDTLALGGAAGGPMAGLEDRLAFRVSAHYYRSNGFRNNRFLNSDDTYERDEFTGRLKLRWTPNDDWQIDFTGLFIQLDNGYDAFAINNGFDTFSDKPGRDAQETVGASLRIRGDIAPSFSLISITSVADSDIEFSFDSDWGNDDFWDQPQFGNSRYDYTSDTERQRTTVTQEFRLLSTSAGRLAGRADWVLGAFLLGLDEDNDRIDLGVDSGFFCPDPCATTVRSAYDATSVALFGQLDVPLSARLALTTGLRWEQRDADYAETFGFSTVGFGITVDNEFSPTDRMWGGEAALRFFLSDATQIYGRIARGYKAGGFNVGLARAELGTPGAVLGPQDIPFEPEYLWSYETGLRFGSSDGRWLADLALFYQDRDDMQVRIPFQVQPGDPNTFLFLTANAAEGRTLGAEASLRWSATERLALEGSVGLLNTEVRKFSLIDRVAGLPAFDGLQGLIGRDFAHAPEYSFSVAADWQSGNGWFARAEIWGRDRFYFDYGHDERSRAYEIVNLRIGKEWERWSVTAWARNLFDEEYAVRGFFFGNEPPNFPNKLYVRLGDPRHYGITIRYRM